MKIIIDEGAKMPTRAHEYDAGLDLYSPIDIIIPPAQIKEYANCLIQLGSATIDTGIHVEIPEGYVGLIKSKSGMNVKYGILSEGVIDAGYTGSVVVKLYNTTIKKYKINAGDKITQLVIVPTLTPELEIVNQFDKTSRGKNGFGSSGKKR